MARKRVVEPSGVKTWEDANDALRQIAEAQLALADIEGEMNKQILGAKKAAEEQSKPYKDRVAKLERELKDFVTEHRADMGKTKTRALTFGEVGFRLSTSVSLPRAKEKIEEIIRRLKTRQMMDCIVVKEDVSKEALKKYGEDTVNAVGATWKQQDVFGYELNFSKLEQVKAGHVRGRASCGSTSPPRERSTGSSTPTLHGSSAARKQLEKRGGWGNFYHL
ncbi:MAG: host-nuclease inhibitor Gam family protein [Sutterella wadsworthensis]